MLRRKLHGTWVAAHESGSNNQPPCNKHMLVSLGLDGLVEKLQDGGPALVLVHAAAGAVRHRDDAKACVVAQAVLGAALQWQPAHGACLLLAHG